MKSLNITYTMEKNHGTCCDPRMEHVQTCITLPMKDDIADDILEKGEESRFMRRMALGYVTGVLSELSEIQGYHYSGYNSVEEVVLTADEEVCEVPVQAYPELRNYNAAGYWDMGSLAKERTGFAITSGTECTCEIIFSVRNTRYYCWLSARDLNDALGKFFRQHPHITYEMIEEHLIDI